MGFAHGNPGGSAQAPLGLPALPTFWWPDLFPGLMEALDEVGELVRFEVEFTSMELPSPVVPLLVNALDLLPMNLTGSEDKPSPMQYFLRLWLQQRNGWIIRARGWIAKRKPVPTAAIEMVGRHLFSAECQVAGPGKAPSAPSAHDLSCCFPQGWPLRPILPEDDESGKLAAGRLLNKTLPELPESGFLIGTADAVEVRLPTESRDRHIYVVGATGTGKTTLLGRMIRADMDAGQAVLLLDPHGDLFEEALAAVPKRRKKDLLLVDPLHPARRPALNILDIHDGVLRKRHTELLIGEMIACFQELWDNPEAFGPMFEVYFRNAIQLLTLRGGAPRTVVDFDLLFGDKDFRDRLVHECLDGGTRTFWTKIAEKAGGEASLANMAPYITSKMAPLAHGAFLSSLVCRPKDEVRLVSRINENPIILVNLSKGILGARESRVMGVILLAQIFSAGLSRSQMKPADRKPVNVYVDEFQNFISDNMASMLSEARKFNLRFVLANQTLAQLSANRGTQNLLETVLGNVGNIILFRLGVPDAARLRAFTEPFTQQEMQELPNFHAMVRLLTAEGPVRPLIMKTMKA